MVVRPEGLRVLIVEDSPDDADLASLQLRRAGFTVACFERVQTAEALQAALDRGGWDVILSDYALPAFSGRAALEAVLARGIDVPFIVVSGSLGEERAVEMMKAGAHDFFPKNNLTRLPSAVEREIREAQRRREHAAAQERAEEERQRLLGELRDAVRARDTFLTLAAHELRTPLTAAQLKLERLRRLVEQRPEEVDGAMLGDGFSVIARQQRRLAALVDNLVEVAAFTSGKRMLTRTNVDLGREVEDALSFLREEVAAAGSDVVRRLQPDVVGRWDAARLQSLIRNLLSNAVRYGQGKPVEVGVSAAGDHAHLTVADHGGGIAVEDRDRIFDKFEHVVTEHHHAGFGLGLWIARRVIEEHSGHMELTSQPGEGTVFIVDLPLDAGALS